MVKKILKIVGVVIILVVVSLASYIGYNYYRYYYSLLPKKSKPFEHPSHYINPKEALLNEGVNVCNEEAVYQYYNTPSLPYPGGKNNFRKYIEKNYQNNNYTDSGYLNIRFIINCEGKAGRFVTHENDLNLEPKIFNAELKEQLFKLTSSIEKWEPIFLYNDYRDCYMYVSYRIENGNITEIIP